MDYADHIVLLANAPAQAKSLLHSLERAASGISLHVNADKTEYMCFDQNQTKDIITQTSSSLKLVDEFTYLKSSVSSTKNDIDTWLAKTWSAISRILVIWQSDRSDKKKCNFFQAAIMSILVYGCTTCMLTKHIDKKLDVKCTRMLRAILNKFWKEHTTKKLLYGHLPPISKTI